MNENNDQQAIIRWFPPGTRGSRRRRRRRCRGVCYDGNSEYDSDTSSSSSSSSSSSCCCTRSNVAPGDGCPYNGVYSPYHRRCGGCCPRRCRCHQDNRPTVILHHDHDYHHDHDDRLVGTVLACTPRPVRPVVPPQPRNYGYRRLHIQGGSGGGGQERGRAQTRHRASPCPQQQRHCPGPRPGILTRWYRYIFGEPQNRCDCGRCCGNEMSPTRHREEEYWGPGAHVGSPHSTTTFLLALVSSLGPARSYD